MGGLWRTKLQLHYACQTRAASVNNESDIERHKRSSKYRFYILEQLWLTRQMNRNKAQRQILLDQLSQLACDEDAQPIDTILQTRDQHQKNYESQHGCRCLTGLRIVQPGVDELAIISARIH